MKTTTLAIGALTAFALLGATQAYAAPSCLRNIDIYNYDAPNEKTLIVETNQHNKFRVSLMGTCYDLRFKQHLAFKTIGGSGLSCMSKGDQVLTRDLGMRQICSITNIEPYTPAMQAADKAAKLAKEQEQQSKP